MSDHKILVPAITDLPTSEGINVPVCVFDGYTKQLAIDNDEALAMIFDAAFPGFRAAPLTGLIKEEYRQKQVPVAEPSRGFDWKLGDMSGKMRRFAGSSVLPRGRYAGVCRWNQDDSGTVVREIFAYSAPSETGIVLIDDMSDARDAASINARYGTTFPSSPYFLLYIQEPIRLRPFAKALVEFDPSEPPQFFRIPYIIQHRRLEQVLDLRLRPVQCWFYEVFSNPETTNLKFPLPQTTCFEEFLPLLLGQHRGGNLLTHCIGRDLQRWGVQGLVYPSARCDVYVKYEDGSLIDWYGWNLVDYSNWTGNALESFGSMLTFNDVTIVQEGWYFYGVPVDEIKVRRAPDAHRLGTWHVVGLDAHNQSRWKNEAGLSAFSSRRA